jgi:hypothetical protein
MSVLRATTVLLLLGLSKMDPDPQALKIAKCRLAAVLMVLASLGALWALRVLVLRSVVSVPVLKVLARDLAVTC